MEEILQASLLYDFYGELLTPRQKQLYEAVYFQDLGLSETAELYRVTRQCVCDTVRKTEKLLHEYEAKLGLVSRFGKLKEMAAEIRRAAAAPVPKKSELEAIAAALEEL